MQLQTENNISENVHRYSEIKKEYFKRQYLNVDILSSLEETLYYRSKCT